MATMKKAAPKAQKGKKVSPMAAYVDKYKNSGGLSGNVANDTLGGNSPRFNNYDGGFAGGRMNQIKDLKAAHDKKFGKNSTVDERKNGGKVAKKKMKNGGSLTGLTASNRRDKGIDPKGAFTKVQKKTLAGAKGKASLTKDKQLGATKMKNGGSLKKPAEDQKGLKALPTPVRNKMGYQKNGGAVKMAKSGAKMNKGRKC